MANPSPDHLMLVNESLRQRYEASWVAGTPKPISECLSGANAAEFLPTLEELVHIQLEFAWRIHTVGTGPRPVAVEALLEEFPVLGDDAVLSRLLRQEYHCREKAGDSPSADDYRETFPGLDLDQLATAPGKSVGPKVSDDTAEEVALGDQATLRPAAGNDRFSPTRDDATLNMPAGHGEDKDDTRCSTRLAPPNDDPNPQLSETLGPLDPVAQQYQQAISKNFGQYELIEVIGKGGMGIVHKARDTKLNRTVALKMILAGRFADTDEVKRFYAEAEAAAKLRHPNIVAVHEFGEAAGQHFFSMDYIEGDSLAELVRANALAPAKAAEMAKKIAAAMHHAHSEKILHRDLKPSNVLLDGDDEPMITDFGLAKQVEGQSQLTMSGTILGTPSYMPPEQASGQLEKVTVVSDVYSIGAILYEMLTGRPPFRAANEIETLKQVLDTEPVAPRMLNPAVPADLETICLKCLQKERAARYATAEELADELGRFLAGEPILARPIGLPSRAWRWCRRNPKIASLAALAVLGFATAFAATTIGYVTASRALTRAEQSLNQLRIAIDRLYTLVSETELLNEPGMQSFRKQLLSEARNLYQETLKQQGDNPTIRRELALSHFRLGRIMRDLDDPDSALETLETAREMQQQLVETNRTGERLAELGDTLNLIGEVMKEQNRLTEALSLYDEAIRVRKSVVNRAPTDVESMRKLANVYMNSGVIERKRAETEEGAEVKQQRYESAMALFKKSQDQHYMLVKIWPGDEELLLDLAKGYYNLGDLAFDMEQDGVSLKNLNSAIEQFGILLERAPGNLEIRYLLALCSRRVADVTAYSTNPQAAHKSYFDAQQRFAQLAEGNPDVHKYRGMLASALLNQGVLYVDFEQNAEAVQAFRKARDILAPLVEKFPLPDYKVNLQAVLTEIKSLETKLGADSTDDASSGS
ncbi:MAG: protein kinase [Pirellulales bacterium]